MHDFHTATAATECSLDGNWPTEFFSEVGDFFCTGAELGGARNNRCTAAQCSLTARDLVAHFDDGSRRWSDECNTHVGDCLCEVGVLAEEAITRVHSICATVGDGLQNCFGVQVALGGSLASEGKCLVGKTHVEGIAIEF